MITTGDIQRGRILIVDDQAANVFLLGEMLGGAGYVAVTGTSNPREVRLLHLESKSFYDRVVAEQKLSERLLLNVLPHSIANRLKGRPEVATDGFAEAIADSFSTTCGAMR